MTLLIALVLGVVQGVFMFVPVSSTSHLVLSQTFLRDRGVTLPTPESPEMVLFDLIVHVGTLVSIGVVMHRRLSDVRLADARTVVSLRIRRATRYRGGSPPGPGGVVASSDHTSFRQGPSPCPP